MTVSLVAQGTDVVTQGKRRWGAAPWFCGQSSLKIGWHGGKRSLSWSYAIMPHLHLSAGADPAPAMVSNIQLQKPLQLFSPLEYQDAVA